MSTVTAPTHRKHDSAAVRRLLAAGQTAFIDPATGHRQAFTADCPVDGQPAGVRRVTRERGAGIMEVTMRCTRCAGDFVAPAQTLYLS